LEPLLVPCLPYGLTGNGKAEGTERLTGKRKILSMAIG
jgi:hypothetical protein